MTETYMNFHGRSKGKEYTYPHKEQAPNYHYLTDLVFTGDKKMGYMSMKECLENQATEKVLLVALN